MGYDGSLILLYIKMLVLDGLGYARGIQPYMITYEVASWESANSYRCHLPLSLL